MFLVIDGWATLRGEFEELDSVVTDIATRGLSYGVHIVVTATRWLDFRHNVKDLFQSKLELRLGEPGDTAINRKAAPNVPAGKPGRGLNRESLHILVAQPQVTGHPPAALVKAVADAWTGPKAPPVRMLPALLPYTSILVSTESGEKLPLGNGLELPLGIAEADLRPVTIEFGSEPHLLVYGDSECGKSSLLRSLAESITRRFTPEEARIVLIDYRRSLLGQRAAACL